MTAIRNLTGAVLVALSLTSATAFAVTSASFVFDTSDVGDLADGPDYNVTGVGLTDDGSGCDSVVMVMVDATGQLTDVDSFCLSIPGGTGGSDGDYGSINTGYVPTVGPVTYALFDINAAHIAALGAYDENDPAFASYVISNGRLLTEGNFPVAGIPTASPYSFVRRIMEVPTVTAVGLGGLSALLALSAWGWRVRLTRGLRRSD